MEPSLGIRVGGGNPIVGADSTFPTSDLVVPDGVFAWDGAGLWFEMPPVPTNSQVLPAQLHELVFAPPSRKGGSESRDTPETWSELHARRWAVLLPALAPQPVGRRHVKMSGRSRSALDAVVRFFSRIADREELELRSWP